MVLTKTHGIDNTHGIDLDSWYRIGTPESHTYMRAECYPYVGFLKHRPSGLVLSISQNVRLSVYLSVRLFVRVLTFEVPFKGLFAPPSRSRMSNISRGSESLGKSDGKKWSQS